LNDEWKRASDAQIKRKQAYDAEEARLEQEKILTKIAEYHARLKVHVDILHPTQFSIGAEAVQRNVLKFNALYREGDLNSIYYSLGRKTVPIVIGPQQTLYMIDRHHTARGLWESDLPSEMKLLPYRLVADFSDLTLDVFWEWMTEQHFTYLKHRGLGPLRPTHLPTHVKDMEDDPYRTLAWAVHTRGGFKKGRINFCELIWAEYLRAQMQGDGKIVKEDHQLSEMRVYEYVDEALRLCHSPEASAMPGYREA